VADLGVSRAGKGLDASFTRLKIKCISSAGFSRLEEKMYKKKVTR